VSIFCLADIDKIPGNGGSILPEDPERSGSSLGTEVAGNEPLSFLFAAQSYL
jgi:hypothetical protein